MDLWAFDAKTAALLWRKRLKQERPGKMCGWPILGADGGTPWTLGPDGLLPWLRVTAMY